MFTTLDECLRPVYPDQALGCVFEWELNGMQLPQKNAPLAESVSSQWKEAPASESICKSPCVLELSLFFEIRTFIYGDSIIDRFATKKGPKDLEVSKCEIVFRGANIANSWGVHITVGGSFFSRLLRFNPIWGKIPILFDKGWKPPTVDIRTLDLRYNWQMFEASTVSFGAPQLWDRV